MRPPKPRYTYTWDVCLVTKYLDSLGKDQVTTLKAPLNQNWQCFLLFPVWNELCPLQSWISGTAVWPQKEFPSHLCLRESEALQINYLQAFFASFPHNKRLCPVDTLRHYLKATRNLRPVFPSSKPDPLFVSYVKPHNPITAPTLSRWLRMVLKNAGIDTDILKAHSVRGSSTTAAVNSNVPLDDVMENGRLVSR